MMLQLNLYLRIRITTVTNNNLKIATSIEIKSYYNTSRAVKKIYKEHKNQRLNTSQKRTGARSWQPMKSALVKLTVNKENYSTPLSTFRITHETSTNNKTRYSYSYLLYYKKRFGGYSYGKNPVF